MMARWLRAETLVLSQGRRKAKHSRGVIMPKSNREHAIRKQVKHDQRIMDLRVVLRMVESGCPLDDLNKRDSQILADYMTGKLRIPNDEEWEENERRLEKLGYVGDD
jgi:hypothetical protein